MAKRPAWEALIGPMDQKRGDKVDVREIAIDLVDPHPDQPRKHFDQGQLQELALSIQESGVLQPIIVVLEGDRYRIVAGQRRYEASKLAGKTTIPAVVRRMTQDEIFLAMVAENLHRADLTPLEEILSLVRLQKITEAGGRSLARTLGKDKDWVSRRLSIGNNPSELARIEAGESIDSVVRSRRPPPHAKPESIPNLTVSSLSETQTGSDAPPRTRPPGTWEWEFEVVSESQTPQNRQATPQVVYDAISGTMPRDYWKDARKIEQQIDDLFGPGALGRDAARQRLSVYARQLAEKLTRLAEDLDAKNS